MLWWNKALCMKYIYDLNYEITKFRTWKQQYSWERRKIKGSLLIITQINNKSETTNEIKVAKLVSGYIPDEINAVKLVKG